MAFIRVSSLMCQLEICPLMNPEMITNSRTRMLIAVKILFIVVDSFTPKAKRPSDGKKPNQMRCMILVLCPLITIVMTPAPSFYMRVAGRELQQRHLGKVPDQEGPWLHLLPRISICRPLWGHQMSRSTPVQRWMSLRRWWETHAIKQLAWVIV